MRELGWGTELSDDKERVGKSLDCTEDDDDNGDGFWRLHEIGLKKERVDGERLKLDAY